MNAKTFYQQRNIKTEKKDENVDYIRQEILRNEGLKIGDKINYEKLSQLSRKYQIDEKRLAIDILGVLLGPLQHLKSDKERNAVILKDFLNEKHMKKISDEILSKKGLQPYTQIDYKMLQELSKNYYINEKALALRILGLTESQYWNIKYNQNNKAYILKGKYKKTKPEELRQLKLKIFENEQLSIGQRIDYKKIERIQKKYNIPIDELLYILGLTKSSYLAVKGDRKQNAIVKDMDKNLTAQILSEIMKKERYYTKDEIEQICKSNDLTTQDFFDYILGKALYFGRDEYKKLLDSKGRIWIGDKSKLSNEFINRNLNQIISISEKVSNYIYSRYNYNNRRLEKEDLKQETFILITETCGDLEKNFEGDDLSKMIYYRARVKMLKHIGTKLNAVSISGYYEVVQAQNSMKNSQNINLELEDTNADTEKEALDKYNEESEKNPIIGYLSKLVEEGYDRNTSLEKTASIFGIDKETMLEAIKEELLKRGKVKKTDKEEYILGE